MLHLSVEHTCTDEWIEQLATNFMERKVPEDIVTHWAILEKYGLSPYVTHDGKLGLWETVTHTIVDSILVEHPYLHPRVVTQLRALAI
ncbi:hypothetical protein C5B42_05560 [Candidatus Cerribacteria bacterium 'Amazon FNV 2010 28 9']|uniref:Uncharacterized protein n=1 Tax=Candidatus Cerribacteria bacterium 'Amazon FNV 2010 28 9' TaxID=2081795 RepID=A0A317JQ17_9BACT|nr:MAG: hypothetical protein C5B42_05560 [Candidatus Cerribacteria bacterium 'Amazon FNV 2010 28 9']